MRRLKLLQCVAALTLTIALVPRTASAQVGDTLSISGTFNMDRMEQTVGADLAGAFARDNEHWWTLTLHGVTYSHGYGYYEWNEEWGYGYHESFVTGVHATSFEFRFFGPDADVLNAAVSQQLSSGDLLDGDFVELWNDEHFDSADPWDTGPYSYGSCFLRLRPLDAGASFYTAAYYFPPFSTDADGYPVVEPRRVTAYSTFILDQRPGNAGLLLSDQGVVAIGLAGPPLPPSLSIQDGSVREGNKGASLLVLKVTLSRSSTSTVTVNYATANGTALAKADYSATSGKLTFQPGQTSRTISVSIITDRKREKNETFSVKLSNAVGATINDGVATATILNDD